MPRNAYKDDLEAAHARIRALEQDNQALKTKLAGGAEQRPRRGWAAVVLTVVVLLGGGAVLVLGSIGGARGAMFAIGVLLVLALPAIVISRLLHTCGPNEALVLSGRRHRCPDGVVRGYRVVLGGRVLRFPFVERVDRFDLGLVRLSVSVKAAYSKGGIPVNIEATAAVQVSTNPLLIGNAVERFLGRSSREVEQVARETLEGNLRGLAAMLTIEEMQQDPERVTAKLLDEAEDDFNRLGLEVELFELQSIRSAV